MNIKSFGAVAGLPAKTIRYYEDVDLVRPARESSGYRVFSQTDVHKMAFLARVRSLGFPVECCRSPLTLYDVQDRESGDVKAIALQHLNEIDQKLGKLTTLRDMLSHLVRSCAGDNRPDCPILSDLAQELSK